MDMVWEATKAATFTVLTKQGENQWTGIQNRCLQLKSRAIFRVRHTLPREHQSMRSTPLPTDLHVQQLAAYLRGLNVAGRSTDSPRE